MRGWNSPSPLRLHGVPLTVPSSVLEYFSEGTSLRMLLTSLTPVGVPTSTSLARVSLPSQRPSSQMGVSLAVCLPVSLNWTVSANSQRPDSKFLPQRRWKLVSPSECTKYRFSNQAAWRIIHGNTECVDSSTVLHLSCTCRQ